MPVQLSRNTFVIVTLPWRADCLKLFANAFGNVERL